MTRTDAQKAHPAVYALHNEASAHGIAGDEKTAERLHNEADALQRAIDALGAVEVAPGRYAVKSPTSGGWIVTDAGGLPAVSDATAKPTKYIEMPTWWSPERRFAWRVIRRGRVLFDGLTEEKARALAHSADNMRMVERVTADLTTGEERPA